MITLSVASGKGGAGKTSIAAAIATILGPGCVFADCDVDAANGAIALGATLKDEEPYFAGPGFRIEGEACMGCGRCADSCRFGAIRLDSENSSYSIASELCERCGACLDLCPAGAIIAYEKQAGSLLVSETMRGQPLVHGDSQIVIDAPPGIGCPVIASLSGVDLVVIVVEASASGIRDAARLIELTGRMHRETLAIINKAGLDDEMDRRAHALIESSAILLAGEIPFEPALRFIEESGGTWLSLGGDVGARIGSAMRFVVAVVDGLSRDRHDRGI